MSVWRGGVEPVKIKTWEPQMHEAAHQHSRGPCKSVHFKDERQSTHSGEFLVSDRECFEMPCIYCFNTLALYINQHGLQILNVLPLCSQKSGNLAIIH